MLPRHMHILEASAWKLLSELLLPQLRQHGAENRKDRITLTNISCLIKPSTITHSNKKTTNTN